MDNEKEHFLTVVFKISDKEKFKSTSDGLISAFQGKTTIEGAEITGISTEDEMTKNEQLLQELSLIP